MILHQSQAQFSSRAEPPREISRTRIGMGGFASVVVLLTLLNLIAGAA